MDGTVTETELAGGRAISAIEVTLIFTAFIAVAYGFGIYLFATLTAEMRADLALDYGAIGLATGSAQGGFLVSSLLSGVLAPRLGPLRLILGSVAATTAALMLMSRLPAGDPFILLTALLTVMGAGAAAVWVPMVAVAQSVIPLRHRGKALGLMSSGTAYGVFLNGLIIPQLVVAGARGSWRDVWLVMGAIAGALLVLGFWRLRALGRVMPVSPSSAAPSSTPEPNRWQSLARPLALLLIATMFLNGLACMPFQTYLAPLLQDDLGLPIAFAGRVWSVIGLTGMVGGFLVGLLADRISIKWAMVLTYVVLAAAALAVLAVSTGHLAADVAMLVAAALFALAFNAIYGLVPAYISTMFGGGATLLFGFGNIAIGLGGLVGNIAGGYAREAAGTFTPIYTLILAATLAQILLAIATPNERKAPR